MGYETEQVERFLGNELRQEDLVFLLGSGVSYASGVPSAAYFLTRTLRSYLGQEYFERLNSAACTGCANLQPETVYERLLRIGAPDCLQIWSELEKWRTPSVTHYWAARLASQSGRPIITTNFDRLFEIAGEQLSLPDIQVFTNSDGAAPPDVKKGRLSVWKIHGTVSDGDVSSLRTTISSISRRNDALMTRLREIASTSSLVIGGYSGRDIDLFPEIRVAFKGRPVYWLDKNFSNTDSEFYEELNERASRMNAVKIPLFPDELAAQHDPSFKEKGVEKSGGAAEPEGEVVPPPHWAELERTIFFAECLIIASRYQLAWATLANASHLLAARSAQFSGVQEPSKNELSGEVCGSYRALMEYYLAMARASHEANRFSACEFAAKEGEKIARRMMRTLYSDAGSYRRLFQCLVAESARMQFAHDVSVPIPQSKAHMIRAALALAVHVVRKKLWPVELEGNASTVKLLAHFEDIEHTIRWYAFLQIRVPNIPHPRARRFLQRKMMTAWLAVYSIARAAGYPNGIANSARMLSRLRQEQKTDLPEMTQESADTYGVLAYATGAELTLRNRAEAACEDADFDRAVRYYEEMRESAATSGAVLNEAKAIIGLVQGMNMLGEHAPAQLQQRLCQIAWNMDAPDWRRYLLAVDHWLRNQEAPRAW